MPNGYAGKVLFIDLTTGLINEDILPDTIYRDFIGGEGLGARILCERQSTGIGALAPENMLGFVTGLLTGCGVPSASRCTVVTKSPLTGTWGDANVGGYFGSELKAAGYDALFFKGRSERPVYLLIREGDVELRDAAELWGMDTIETTETLRRDTGDPGFRVACIGPAGERLSLISAVVSEGRTAGRSGVGAVMGSKNLKAVAVRGDKQVQVADPEAIKVLRKKLLKDIKESDAPFINMLKGHGTCAGVSMMVNLGGAPIKNWKLAGEEAMPTHAGLDGESITRFQQKRAGCAGCPIMCGGIVKLDEGPYAGTITRKPEYETLIGLGTLCLNDNAESVIKANDICDRYGIDTISAGASIAFAMECYEHRIITKHDTGGLELTWGNSPAIIAMLEKMGKREGIGDVLADGVKKAAKKIGKGSEEYAMHIGGQELPYHDPRFLPGRGFAYISDPTPGRHMRATALLILERGGPLAPYPELEFDQIELTDYSNKGSMYAMGMNYQEVFSSCGFCLFMMNIPTLPLVDFISAATGWDISVNELLKTGKRLQTLRQAFNVREGIQPQDINLPSRLRRSASLGPMKDAPIDFETLREKYCQEMGWNPKTGRPSEECLADLGLQQVVGTLSS